MLRDLKRRDLPAPMLAMGDGASGSWAGLRNVYPDTQDQSPCKGPQDVARHSPPDVALLGPQDVALPGYAGRC